MTTANQQFHRLTIEDVKKDWESGLCPASMYLLGIVRVSRAIGWDFRIESVDGFCDEWGIPRRSFYRAKNQLINAGLMEEEIQGAVVIRLCATNVTTSATNVTATPLKPNGGAASESPTDLIQISLRSNSEKKEPEIFSDLDSSELSANAQNPEPEEDPTPLPPAPARQFEHPAIAMERRLRGNAPAKRSGYTSLNPWNIDNDPNKIDPEFKAYLVNTSDYIKFDEKPSAIRVEQWVGMANKDEARRSMVLGAWNEFAAERDRIAAIREERAKLTQANDPENNAAYKRFKSAIARHPKSLRVEVTDYNWQGLKVNMWYRGIPIMTQHPFNASLLREVAIGINRNGGKMPLGKLKQILQLEDWDDLFPRSIWRQAA